MINSSDGKVLNGNILIQEGQIYLLKGESKEQPVLKGIGSDNLGVVISLKNGDNYCYNKHISNAPIKILEVFDKLEINPNDIDKINLIGGLLNNPYPIEGQKMKVIRGDNKGYKPGMDFKFNFKDDICLDSKSPELEDYISNAYRENKVLGRTLEDSSKIDDKSFASESDEEILSSIDIQEYTKLISDYICQNNPIAKYNIASSLGENALECNHEINSIEQLSGYQNIKIMMEVLKKLYGQEIVSKIFHINNGKSNNILLNNNKNIPTILLDKSYFKVTNNNPISRILSSESMSVFFECMHNPEAAGRYLNSYSDNSIKISSLKKWGDKSSSLFNSDANEFINTNSHYIVSVLPNVLELSRGYQLDKLEDSNLLIFNTLEGRYSSNNKSIIDYITTPKTLERGAKDNDLEVFLKDIGRNYNQKEEASKNETSRMSSLKHEQDIDNLIQELNSHREEDEDLLGNVARHREPRSQRGYVYNEGRRNSSSKKGRMGGFSL